MGVSKSNLCRYCSAATLYANSYAAAPRLGLILLVMLISLSRAFEDYLRLYLFSSFVDDNFTHDSVVLWPPLCMLEGPPQTCSP